MHVEACPSKSDQSVSESITVGLAHSSPLVLAMLESVLESALESSSDDVVIAFRATSLADAEAEMTDHQPDVVVADYLLPDGHGFELQPKAAAAELRTRVVLFGNQEHRCAFDSALAAGCAGFVTKEGPADQLARAVRSASEGIDSYPNELLVERLRDRHDPGGDLSARELELLRMLASGAVAGGIAADLDISIQTVRNHVRSVLRKTDSSSQLEAVIKAVRAGLVQVGVSA